MTDPMTVAEGEHGLVRLFLVHRPSDLHRGDLVPLSTLAEALGVAALRPEDVQQIWTDDMTDMSLQQLLMSGYGISAEEMAKHHDLIESAMEAHPAIFAIIRSSAFMDRPVTLTSSSLMSLIATLREPDASVDFEPLPNPDPNGVLVDAPQKKPPSDAAMSGRVATIALVVMALLVGVMIWVAG